MPTLSHILRSIFFVLALTAPMQCFAKKEVPLVPDATTAVLNGNSRHAGPWDTMGLAISRVDGKGQGGGLFLMRFPLGVRLMPGKHSITLTYRTFNSEASSDLWFIAEAGKAYSARMDGGYSSVRFWIEETATGRVVGGINNGDHNVDANTAKAATETEAASPAIIPVADGNSAILICDPGKPGRGYWQKDYAESHLQIARLDGVKQPHFGTKDQILKLTPGRHTVGLEYRAGRGGFTARELAFEAEPGLTYALREQLNGYAVRFWIEEAATGKVVADTQPKLEQSPPPAPPTPTL